MVKCMFILQFPGSWSFSFDPCVAFRLSQDHDARRKLERAENSFFFFFFFEKTSSRRLLTTEAQRSLRSISNNQLCDLCASVVNFRFVSVERLLSTRPQFRTWSFIPDRPPPLQTMRLCHLRS